MDPLLPTVDVADGGAVSDSLLTRATSALRDLVGSAGAALTQGPGPDLLPDGAIIAGATRLTPVHRWYDLWFGPSPREFTGEPRPIEVFALQLRREPWFEVRPDGSFLVRWETIEPTPPAHVYWGVTIPDQDLPVPRYRRDATEALATDPATGTAPVAVTAHAFEGELRRLERPVYDVANLSENAGGTVVVRIEQPLPADGSTRLWDRRFAYRRGDDGIYSRVPAVVEGPFVDMVSLDRFVLSFDTDFPVRAAVALSSASFEEVVLASEPSTHFEIALPELAPAQRVHYRLVIAGEDGSVLPQPSRSFRTRASGEERFSFAVMSDSRSGVGPGEEEYEGTNMMTLRRFFVEAWNAGTHFVVFPGDLIDGYTTQRSDFLLQLHAWQDSAELIGHGLPIFEGMGNHETWMTAWENGTAFSHATPESPESLFASVFTSPANGPTDEGAGTPPYLENVYSWDWGNSHFVMLNTNYWWSNLQNIPDAVRMQGEQNREGYLMDRQLEWLDADLASARERGLRHIFVFAHEPAFPQSFHGVDAMWWSGADPAVVARRDAFIVTLMRHGVLAFFAGDEHNYTRTLVDSSISSEYPGQLWSVISGGCGAPFYDVIEYPWSSQLRASSSQQNWVRIDVDGDHVRGLALGDTGETLDSWDLTWFE